MNNTKIALVNPPGTYEYIRDYYTSLIAKANYHYPPIDFVWLSASLEGPVKVFDAIAEGLSPEKLLDEAAEFAPTHIFCLVSGLSLEEDLALIKKMKERTNAVIIAMGDICRVAPGIIFSKSPHIDAVLRSFACTDIMGILRNGRPAGQYPPEWVFRSGAESACGELKKESGNIRIGVPKWEIFRLKAYKFPFALNAPVGTILTDYGCPFKCSYCSIGTLGWRVRESDEVIDEIDLLYGLGAREIHFRDQTFGVDKERTMLIMDHLKKKRLTWSCFTRMDIVSEKLLAAMKESGCHTVIFGIESGDYELRHKYGKGIKDDIVIRTLKLCSGMNISTVGTFIIGLPGEGEKEVMKTIEFARTLPLDYASFNIAVPRMGSALRSPDGEGLRTKEDPDIGYNSDAMGFMPREKAIKLASLATRRFYVRPSYIMNRLSKIRSLSVLINEFKIGHNLLFGAYSYKKKS
ncbi:MAG: radical SAM protein [Candidatus Omnitrophica bacterium]|nr:radical SAM protein [Candidatus Omnitrophota bacterium]